MELDKGSAPGIPAKPSASVSSPSVFIVDDDSSLRRSLERLLRLEGWPVRTFGSAEEFLEQCSDGVRGCLVADVHLGRMSGLELQAILARTSSALPVILTSGFDDGLTEAEAARLGAFAYLKKPFEASELIEAVKRGMHAGAPETP